MGWVETTDRQQIPERAVTQKQITSYFCANNSPGREEPRAVNSVEETRSLLHMEETDTVGRPQRVEEGGEESTEKEAEVMVMQEEEEEEENDDHKGQKTELFCATATSLVDQTLQQGFLLSGVSAAVRCEMLVKLILLKKIWSKKIKGHQKIVYKKLGQNLVSNS